MAASWSSGRPNATGFCWAAPHVWVMTDEPSQTDETPDAVEAAAAEREAFEPAAEGYHVQTTNFDARVTARPANEWATAFTVTVDVPTLPSVVSGTVGDAVAEGWRDTFERRLAEAPKATRATVDLDEFRVESGDDALTVVYEFSFGDAGQGLDVAKTLVEYVEGTYVEGVVPGYEYEGPVADLLSEASQGDGERGGTPL